MTIKELIDQLSKIENKDAQIFLCDLDDENNIGSFEIIPDVEELDGSYFLDFDSSRARR